MSNNSRILLGVGNDHISRIIRSHMATSDRFHIIDQEVMHFSFLEEVLDVEDPDILIVHDVFLPSNTIENKEREKEWLNFFHFIRQRYDQLRVVYFCEREKDDVFLNHLISLGIHDIFNKKSVDMNQFMIQLSEPSKYANVAKFRNTFQTEAIKFEPYSSSKNTDKDSEAKNDEENNEQDEASKISESREIIVEKTVAYPFMKKIVLVGAPLPRSGSTFVSHLIAKEIAALDVSVSYFENPFQRAYSYDRFDGHHKTDYHRSIFHSYLKGDTPEPPITYDWSVDNVDMVVKHPQDERIYTDNEINFELFIKVLLSQESAVSIIDVGSDWEKDAFKALMDVASDVIMINEPDINLFQFLGDPMNLDTAPYRDIINSDKTTLVGNRFSEDLLKNKIVKDFYGDSLDIVIPDFPSLDIFEAQEEGTFFNDHPNHNEDIKRILSPLLWRLLPEDLLNKQKKKSGLLRSFFQKKGNNSSLKVSNK